MSLKIEQVVTITAVKAIEMSGTLTDDEDHGWRIVEPVNTPIDLEGWLRKFEGQRVRIRIEHMDGPFDEAHLLKAETMDRQDTLQD